MIRTQSDRGAANGAMHVDLAATTEAVRSAMIVVAVFSLVINLLMLTAPIYMLQIYDRVLGSGRIETLILLTLIAAVAILVMSVLDTLRSSLTVRTGAWLNDRLGPLYLESGVTARLKGAGNGAEPLRDLAQVQSFIATQGLVAFFDMPWAPIFIALIWVLHPWLGMVALVSGLLLLLCAFATEWITRGPSETAHTVHTRSMRLAETTIRNAEAVRAMGFLPAMVDRWRISNSAATDALRIAHERGGLIMALTKFVRFFVQIAILAVGAWLVLQNELTAGAMIAASIMLGRALAPVELVIGAWKNFVQARQAWRRLQSQLMSYPPPAERTQLPRPEGRLDVEGVTYLAPGTSQAILAQVSFQAEPGEAIAMIGPSGAGKSTLCRLLVGLAEPHGGSVRIDGSDVRNWDPLQLGRSVGFLPQEVELFDGSVSENISRMGYATDYDVLKASMAANAHDVIQRLPQGYDTLIGNANVRLSGGQRQRIGLARAVFGSPRLIVLDEPNANLDQVGEFALADAIASLKQQGCVLIIVGHRPSTLAQADKILVIKDGTSAMFGPRDEILRVLTVPANKPGDAQPLPAMARPKANGAHP